MNNNNILFDINAKQQKQSESDKALKEMIFAAGGHEFDRKSNRSS